MKTIIIIPTYNEKENIKPLIQAIFNLGINNLGILVIDDNSPDNTAHIVKVLQNQYPTKLHIIVRSDKLGLGSAYIAGFKWAMQNNMDLIFEMDADWSHDPQDIPRLIDSINKQNADVVIGSRRIKQGEIIGWNFYRHLMSWSAMALARFILNLKTKDVTAGFRCYRKEVLQKINLNQITSNGYAFQEEMVWLCENLKFKVVEVPITFKDRNTGQSKLSTKDIREFFITLFKLKFKNINVL